jgi:hypothetical protein
MTLARACGVVINGVEGLVVDIEAYLSQGLPGMTIVGLPDTAVGEARDRVRAAVQNSDCPLRIGRMFLIDKFGGFQDQLQVPHQPVYMLRFGTT